MTTAFVLMTAMPPTKGHLNLIRFAASSGVDKTVVVVCTQPGEPYAYERYDAVSRAVRAPSLPYDVEVIWLNKRLEQDPSVPGFWEMWDSLMMGFGFKPGDYCVSSEAYGQILATRLKGHFLPYDPQRELYYTKATNIRENLVDYFDDILPEFQHNLVTTVTVFGAESVGKTTLSHALADEVKGHWIYEWARPYLELTGHPINLQTMAAIWKGQAATQLHAKLFTDKAFIIQDTDLFSTIGYWEQPHWQEVLGPVPERLIKEAQELKSDHYVFLKSNIPFEPDPLRYGVDKRESDDAYWLSVAEKYDLPYTVINSSTLATRLDWAVHDVMNKSRVKSDSIFYDRNGL